MIIQTVFFCVCIALCHASQQTLNIRLPNGIEALLISDPSFTESSASLSIEAGSWDDPEEHPGMAHFVEHLLFLGTGEFPEENDFSRYVLERGGEYNAYTRWDRTAYGFSIPKGSFAGALDRFSHFFINPLFTSSAIEREIHAVGHEFEDSIEDDSLRLWRVLKESGNPNHPNRKLSCGNLTSLSKLKRADVKKWFNIYYRPECMKLVLMSSESLEELETQASYYFSRISSANKKEKIKLKKEKITSLEQRGSFIYLKPAFKNRSLFLIWEVPSNIQAVQLLQLALENSLVHILAEDVQVEFWKISEQQSLFIIDITLSDEGLSQHEEVISKCFQVLNGLKQVGIPEHLMKRIDFHPSFESNLDGVMKIASELIDGERESNSVAEANSLLLELTPFEWVYVFIAAPEEVGVKLSRIEKWMGASYAIRKIPQEKLQQWNEEDPYPLQEMEDVPFDEPRSEIEEKDPDPDPFLLMEDERGSIHWIEPSLNSGSLDAFFFIATPLPDSFPKQEALNAVFLHRLNMLLKQEFDQEIFWDLEIEGSNLSLHITVAQEECFTYFRRFFSLLKKAKTSKRQFEKVKKDLIDSYPGDPPLLDYAEEILDSILNPAYSTQVEVYNALLEVEFEEYKAFERLYFKELFVEAVVLGGKSQQQIIELWEEVILALDAKPYKVESSSVSAFPILGDFSFLYKTHRRGNALLLLVESEEQGQDLESIHKILTVLLRTEFFKELRTKQQTAYQLHTWIDTANEKICHYFSIQSSTHAPSDLLYRVENFLNDFAKECKSLLSLKRFELIRDMLILQEENEKAKEALKNLAYNQVLNQIPLVFSKENRRQIAVLIEGQKETPSATH